MEVKKLTLSSHRLFNIFQLQKVITLNHLIYALVFIVLVSAYWFYIAHAKHEMNQHSEQYIYTPQVNDFYFLDFQLITENLRPYEKFRLAKVVDVTGDIVTLLYSDFFYSQKVQIERAIKYGHLRYHDYFQGKRYDFSKQTLVTMYNDKVIYRVERAVNQKLFGYLISPENIEFRREPLFVLGKKEYLMGIDLLRNRYLEVNLSLAFEQLLASATLGYPQGQVALAELYLNNDFTDKNLEQSLYWLLQASLQSHKPAILKYIIVCKQVANCHEYDFYQTLLAAGVNLKVKHIDVKLRH